MRRSNSRRNSAVENDLKRLGALAYHRLESSDDLVRRFRRLRRTGPVDSDRLKKLYDWLFVPITLWPVNIEGLFRIVLDRVTAGKRLDKTLILLIDLLPPLPSDRTQRAVFEHEHSVQHGNYESLIRARYKYDQVESQLARDSTFQAQWNAIKAHFDVTKFADHKGIVRRRLVSERSMREHWPFRWTKAPQIVFTRCSMCFVSSGIFTECAAISPCSSSSLQT